MEDKKDIKDVTKETENLNTEDKKETTAKADEKQADNTSRKESEKKETGKAEESEKKVATEKAEGPEKKAATEKTEESEKKPATEKTEEQEKKPATEKKEDSAKEDKAEKSDRAVIEEGKKPEDKKVTNNAVTQSKRIAEAQAAAKQQQENSSKDKKTARSEKKGRKGIIAGIGCVISLLLIAYIAGVVYFSGHFYKDVTINGIEVSGMNEEQAKTTLDQFYSNYRLTLKTVDAEDAVIGGKDIDIRIALHDDFGKCLKEQQSFIWFVNYFEHHEYQVGADVTWDDALLNDVFDDMKILDKKEMTAPEDAYVGVKDGKFGIVDEVTGNTIKEKTFKKAVKTALAEVQSELDLKDNDCYELPKVYATDRELQEELDALGKYADCNIELQLDDLTIEPGMDLYEEVLEKKNGTYELSESKVKSYVAKLAKEYDTLDTDRTFTTSFNDKKVKVYGSAFGYKINQEETEAALLKALKAGKSAKVDVVFEDKGFTLQGENDIGDTYIEVNLSEQKVIGYKNGKKIAEGDCVSGKESAGNGTCIGLYKIQDKLSPTVLRGEKKPVTKTETKKNKKGKKVKKTTTTYEYEYESPVTYWIQFNGGIGLHDAAGWRSQYGGSIYYYSGSHGCVNLPLDLAKTLYENYELGDPVVVYFWDNENRK